MMEDMPTASYIWRNPAGRMIFPGQAGIQTKLRFSIEMYKLCIGDPDRLGTMTFGIDISTTQVGDDYTHTVKYDPNSTLRTSGG